jgi:hypothetical protein
MGVKLISDKVSYSEKDGNLRLVILGKIEGWKEGLLTAWLLVWIFCGGVVGYELYRTTDQDYQLGYVIFLVFWLYFLWKVGRTWAFRRGGNELIEVNDDRLVLKRSFFRYGKAREYFIDNITAFGPIELSPTSFTYVYENAWWNLGGEKLSFEYQGRFVRFCMQTDEKETGAVYRLIRERIRKHLKKKS